MDDRSMVNGLRLPPPLVSMVETGHWRHPGDEVLRAVIPFLDGPMDFLPIDDMRWGSDLTLADFEPAVFHMARGSRSAAPVELPWLDVEKAVFIAINRIPGDDLAIVLDYRTGPDDPRVVASEWLVPSPGRNWREVAGTFTEFIRWPGRGRDSLVPSSGCVWREVAGTFTEFIRRLGLGSDG